MSNGRSEKVIPPAPNLTGEDVGFVRYDPETGMVISHGMMNRSHIRKEQEAGVHIIEHNNHEISFKTHRVDHKSKRILEDKTGHTDQQQSERDLAFAQWTIQDELRSTDKYFLSDALDNLSQSEQTNWRVYRQALRAAYQSQDVGRMTKVLEQRPKPHPKPKLVWSS